MTATMHCDQVVTFVEAPLAHVQQMIESSAPVDTEAIIDNVARLTSAAITEIGDRLPRLDHMSHADAVKLDGHLVHFRGMLQDELSPDYATSVHIVVDAENREHRANGLYVDEIQLPEGASLRNPENGCDSIRQRSIFTCVSVPGANAWTGASPMPVDSAAIPKDASGRPIAPSAQSLAIRHAHPLAARRHRHSVEHAVAACRVKLVRAVDQRACINKVYDMYGVLHMPTARRCTEDDKENADEVKRDSATMEVVPKADYEIDGSATDMPTMHVTYMTRMEASAWHSHARTRTDDARMKEERERCLQVLGDVFGGDKLAAELALYAIVANVSHRDDTPVGRLVVNVGGVLNRAMVDDMDACIRQLVAHSSTLPITIASLNSSRMAPRKDHTLERLVSGRLQLADGTRLVVDETCMDEGTLDDVGVHNVRSLTELMTRSAVAYDFQFHQQEFQNDWNILTLSSGKSMFPSDMHMMCAPRRDSTFDETAVDDAMRRYVDDCREARPDIEEGTRASMEQWYVSERQRDKTMSHEVLNRNIVLASLAAVTRGSSKVVMQDWNRALSLVILAKSSTTQ